MSAPKLTKKQRKGLAFRERKGKKPRLERGTILDEELALPQADPPLEDLEEDSEHPSHASKALKPPVKPKKRKRDVEQLENAGAAPISEAVTKDSGRPGGDDGGAEVDESATRKAKKRKVSKEEGSGEDKTKTGTASKTRFILFVGNLKYTTSLNEIQAHFATCDPPPKIRLLTPKPKSPASTLTKSKGCAFLEFTHRNALQQALKLHGSTLDGRRINVELTAGGGGKSEQRVQKVQARNKHLLDERKARVQKTAETGGEVDTSLTAPPQRHSTTSGLEEVPQKRRTWTVPEEGEVSGRGGVKKRGKKGRAVPRHLGTGANAVAVG